MRLDLQRQVSARNKRVWSMVTRRRGELRVSLEVLAPGEAIDLSIATDRMLHPSDSSGPRAGVLGTDTPIAVMAAARAFAVEHLTQNMVLGALPGCPLVALAWLIGWTALGA
jgi:hypothetical protein